MFNKYKQAIIRDREKRAAEARAPKTDHERQHHTSLLIFAAMFKLASEQDRHPMTGHERARVISDMADEAAEKIAAIWRQEPT